MTGSQAARTKLQFNTRQLAAGSILIGIGGVVALAGAALAGTALVTAYRERMRQMEVPPSVRARQSWDRVKAATAAGLGEFRNGQHPAQATAS